MKIIILQKLINELKPKALDLFSFGEEELPAPVNNVDVEEGVRLSLF